MEIEWAFSAKLSYYKSIDYWEKETGSFEYPLKIIQAVELLEKELSQEEVIYFGRYSRELDLYVRNILKGRFQIYFSVNEEKKKIEITHFKGAKQDTIKK